MNTRTHHLRYLFALALAVMIAVRYEAPRVTAVFAPINASLTQAQGGGR